MAFCGNCGKELVEGEVCVCQKNYANNVVDTAPGQETGASNTLAQLSLADKLKLMIIAGSIFTIIGCFLPLAEVSLAGYSVSPALIDGDGVFIIIASIIGIVLAIFKKLKISTFASAISFAIVVIDGAQIPNVLKEAGSYAAAADISMGTGFYLILFASIISVAGGILAWVKKL